MEEFESEVKNLERKYLPVSKDEKPVVFYGSSSFRLWSTLQRDFPNLNCINLAFGGSTIDDCVRYFDRLLARSNPSRIVFYAGDNDIGQGANADMVIERLKKLLNLVRTKFGEIDFTFVSIKPSPVRAPELPKIQGVNDRVAKMLLEYNNCHYVDVHSFMLTADGQPNSELFIEDMLHMNRKGYEIWKDIIGQHLHHHELGMA